MIGKDAFSYVYHILELNGYLKNLSLTNKAIKTNKILFFAELYHRYFFKKPMITDTQFKALPNGPALNKKEIEWDNIETNYNYLNEEEKETIKICMKEWLCQMSPEALSELSHGDGRIELKAWRNVKNYGDWGSVPISDDALNNDAEILHSATKHQYKNRIKIEDHTV